MLMYFECRINKNALLQTDIFQVRGSGWSLF